MKALACIHGRFQIFHSDHLRYLLEAYRRSERLIVGITAVEGLRETQSQDHRLRPEDNPLSYFERTEMIRAAILGVSEIDFSRLTFSPFPIEQPELIPGFIPRSVTCHTTVRESWNSQKAEILKNLGYEVSILYEDLTKNISGTRIRSLIRKDDESWKSFVPKRVACFLEEGGFLSRIKNA